MIKILCEGLMYNKWININYWYTSGDSYRPVLMYSGFYTDFWDLLESHHEQRALEPYEVNPATYRYVSSGKMHSLTLTELKSLLPDYIAKKDDPKCGKCKYRLSYMESTEYDKELMRTLEQLIADVEVQARWAYKIPPWDPDYEEKTEALGDLVRIIYWEF